jgi:DNA-binding IclR family transcriptional regulator
MASLPASVDLGSLEAVDLNDRRLSRSVLLGLMMLAALARDGGWVALSALAPRLDMSKSTAHRYVNTLVAVGLVEQEAYTRRYRLTQ